MNDAIPLTVSLIARYGAPAMAAIFCIGFAGFLTWFFLRVQVTLAERERIHQQAVETTFQMYQQQLAENRLALDVARERIASLENRVTDLQKRPDSHAELSAARERIATLERQVNELKNELKATLKRRGDFS